MTLSDQFLLDIINDVQERRQELNVIEIAKMIKEIEGYIRFFKLGHLAPLLPEVVDKYGEDSNLTVIFAPNEPVEEFLDYVKKSNKIVFKNNSIEILIAIDFDMAIQSGNDPEWKVIRRGYFGFGGTVQVRQKTENEEEVELIINPKLSLKKLGMRDPT